MVLVVKVVLLVMRFEKEVSTSTLSYFQDSSIDHFGKRDAPWAKTTSIIHQLCTEPTLYSADKHQTSLRQFVSLQVYACLM